MNDLISFLRQLDEALRRVASATVLAISRFFQSIADALVRVVRQFWDEVVSNEDADAREAIAVQRIAPELNNFDAIASPSVLDSMVRDSAAAVDRLIEKIMESPGTPSAYSPDSNILEELLSRVQSYALGLKIAIADATRAAFGQRTSPRALEEAILGHVGGFSAKLQRFAATETVALGNRRIREWARAAGMKFVMRLAVMDGRTCQWCAARSGNIYRIENAPKLLHPNDRCYYLPVSLETVKSRDVRQYIRQHREQLRKELSDRNLSFAYGLSPFERLIGLIDVPEPYLGASDLL